MLNLRKSFFCTLPLIICAVITLRAQSEEPTYRFLLLEMNARAAGMGNTFLTMTNDPTVMFYNPAGLSTLEKPAGSVGFLKHVLDVNAGFASYGQDVEGIGWIGGGVRYLNYGTFEGADILGNPASDFSAGDLALTATYANSHENLRYGGSLKFVYSGIADASSTALALDLGVLYLLPDYMMVVGASVLNAGAVLSTYGPTSLSLPLDVKIGVSKKLEHLPLNLSLNFHRLTETQDNFFQHFSNFSIGGEFTLSSALLARIGYNNERRQDLKLANTSGLGGFSFGLGILVSDFRVDYAFSSWGGSGRALHFISVGTTL